MEQATSASVERIRLMDELEHRVALATVHVGGVQISGLVIWRSGNGRLRVYWPRYWDGAGQVEAIGLPPEVRADIEADVIAAYKEARDGAKRAERQKGRKQ